MKKILWFVIFVMFLISFKTIFAADMMTSKDSTKTTMEEVEKGKIIFDKLQAKLIDCKSLTDDDYDLLGDYYMDQKVGSAHASINDMMSKMMGENGERQMHIAMAKRLSGCDLKAIIPENGMKFMSIMGMDNDEEASGTNGMMSQKMKDMCPMMKMMDKGPMGNNMFFKGFSWVTFLMIWLLLLLSLIALFKYVFFINKNK